MRSSLVIFGMVGSIFLVSCGDEPAPDSKTMNQAPESAPKPQSDRDRQINNMQAASAVGYDGDALKRSVQKTVDTLENHTAATQAATDAADQSAPDANK